MVFTNQHQQSTRFTSLVWFTSTNWLAGWLAGFLSAAYLLKSFLFPFCSPQTVSFATDAVAAVLHLIANGKLSKKAMQVSRKRCGLVLGGLLACPSVCLSASQQCLTALQSTAAKQTHTHTHCGRSDVNIDGKTFCRFRRYGGLSCDGEGKMQRG